MFTDDPGEKRLEEKEHPEADERLEGAADVDGAERRGPLQPQGDPERAVRFERDQLSQRAPPARQPPAPATAPDQLQDRTPRAGDDRGPATRVSMSIRICRARRV